MSLILDALNRARDSVDPVPTLATYHPVEPVPAGGRKYLLWVILALAIALVAWLVWDRLSTSPVAPAADESPVAELTRNIGSAATAVTSELKARAEEREEAAPLPASVPAQAPADVATRADATGGETTTTGTKLPVADSAPAEPEVAGAVPPVPEPAPEIAKPAPAVADAAVARLYRDRSTAEEDQQEVARGADEGAAAGGEKEQAIDIEDVLRRAQEEAGNAHLDDHPVPFLSSLSQQVKNEIPTIYYRRHDYSSEAGKSTVTLNGKTVSVGGSPGAGLKVEEILPDSVVLNYRGTQFRLRALNSWVNL